MRNAWLITKREYLEKVRAKSFLIATLAMPLIISLFILPGKLVTMRMGGTRHLVVVSADAGLAARVQQELQKTPAETSEAGKDEDDDPDIGGRYIVNISSDLSDAERNRLRDRITNKQLDGYIWLGPEELASRKITYGRRETGDFMDQSAVRGALRSALVSQALARHSVPESEAAEVLKDVKLDLLQVDRGQEKKVNAGAAFYATFALVLMLYTTVLFYGVAVMRSVIEEKSSRVLEVLLSSLTPKELMAGKVIGVGAVGLTQIAIWSVLVAIFAAPGAIAADFLRKTQVSPMTFVWFGAFFLLGYLLYATMYAALGAMVNTEQEGQQLQIVIMLPLILAISLAWMVIRDPNGTLATWLSMFPLVAPVLMYLRIAMQTPPLWQILLCLALLVATIYGMIVLCSRIYRVGILMYGKRPTLPELVKWIKYAGA